MKLGKYISKWGCWGPEKKPNTKASGKVRILKTENPLLKTFASLLLHVNWRNYQLPQFDFQFVDHDSRSDLV